MTIDCDVLHVATEMALVFSAQLSPRLHDSFGACTDTTRWHHELVKRWTGGQNHFMEVHGGASHNWGLAVDRYRYGTV